MKTWWRCRADWLAKPESCDAGGTYSQANGGDSGAAAKHTRETNHPTIAGPYPTRLTTLEDQ